jgi:drug/metabolite transporter (DMT)-like permease
MKIARVHLLFAVMCLVWGTTWLAVKAGITAVPPCFFAGTRFVVAGLALLQFLWWRGDPLHVARVDLPRFAAVTLLMITATYALLFWGAGFVSSGLAAVLDMAFMPVALLTIGALLGEDRFTTIRTVGVAVGVGGLLVLFGPKAFGGEATGRPMEFLGSAAIVMSALVYSLGSVLARPLLRTYSPVLVSGVSTLGGGGVLLAGSLALEPGAVHALSGHWGGPAWAGWAFLVLFGSLVAYTIFLHLVRAWGASRAGAYAFVSPAVAVLLGMIVFREVVTLMDVLGMAAMLAGAWLTLQPTLEDVNVRKEAVHNSCRPCENSVP